MLLLSLFNLSVAEPITVEPNALLQDEYSLERRRGKKKRQRRRRARKKAAENRSMHGLTLGVGTLGGTLGYVYAPNSKISFSGQYSALPAPPAEYTFSDDGSTYTDTTNLSTLTLRGNVHPFQRLKWFHVSAGVAYSMSSITLDLPDGTHNIGGEADTSTSGTGTVDFSDIQPYIGIGGGYTNKKGLNFFLDVGTNFQGAPVVEMNWDSNAADASLDAETDAINTHYSAYQYFLVIQLGINYMF